MPASRVNYIVIHKTDSQVLGSASKDIALTTPLPEGVTIDDRIVGFITYEPDNERLCFYPISEDEIKSAQLVTSTRKKKDNEKD